MAVDGRRNSEAVHPTRLDLREHVSHVRRRRRMVPTRRKKKLEFSNKAGISAARALGPIAPGLRAPRSSERTPSAACLFAETRAKCTQTMRNNIHMFVVSAFMTATVGCAYPEKELFSRAGQGAVETKFKSGDYSAANELAVAWLEDHPHAANPTVRDVSRVSSKWVGHLARGPASPEGVLAERVAERRDDVDGLIWYRHKFSVDRDNPRRHETRLEAYVGRRAQGGPPWLRFRAVYHGHRWLFAKSISGTSRPLHKCRSCHA